MKPRTLIMITVFSVALLFGGYVLFSADLDNVFHVQTKRDLQTVLDLPAATGRTVQSAVAAAYPDCKWLARHMGDEMYLTVVRCDAVGRNGAPVILAWEVGHDFTPHPKIAKRKLFITALTPAAAQLTPQFIPPGLSMATYPDDKVPLYHSSALYGYASGNWVGGDPSKTR